MKNFMVRVLMALSLVVGPTASAFAGISYDAYGRVVNDGQGFDYESYPFTTEDLAVIGASAVAFPTIYQFNPAIVQAVAPATVIVWGAWRTAKYRSQEAKDEMHSALLKQRQYAPAGSITELTQ